jgi:hypothetical protein
MTAAPAILTARWSVRPIDMGKVSSIITGTSAARPVSSASVEEANMVVRRSFVTGTLPAVA